MDWTLQKSKSIIIYFAEAITCPAGPALPHGRIVYSKEPLANGRYPQWTGLQIYCNKGYFSTGVETASCSPYSDGWSRGPVTCEGDEKNTVLISKIKEHLFSCFFFIFLSFYVYSDNFYVKVVERYEKEFSDTKKSVQGIFLLQQHVPVLLGIRMVELHLTSLL